MTGEEAKPLHVRVAEALGCAPHQETNVWWRCTCGDYAHNSDGEDGGPHESGILCDYDTDWSATGPLIERYRIAIDVYDYEENAWYARFDVGHGHDGEPFVMSGAEEATGPTPLLAVCNLILALAAAGKLEVQ